MAQSLAFDEPLARLASVLKEHTLWLVGAGATILLAGSILLPGPVGMAALSAGASLVALAVFGQGVTAWRRSRRRFVLDEVAALAGQDPAPSLLCDPDGEVRYVNPAARSRFTWVDAVTLTSVLGDLFASPTAVLHRLQDRASALGGPREDVVTRRGHVRLTVIDLGRSGYLWRFEEVAEARGSAAGTGVVGLPMLIAAPSGAILFLNEAMREALGARPKHLDRVVSDLPLRSGEVHFVSCRAGLKPFRVAVLEGAEGRSEAYFLPVEAATAHAGGADAVELEDLPVGLLLLGPEGAVVSANRVARDLLRADAAGIVGQPLAERLEGLGRPVRDWLDEAAKGRGLGRPEVLRVSSGDADSFLQVTLGRVSGRGGARLMAVLHDATEHKTLEAQFVQSQKMQAIGQLAGGVAHDFNNLLTAISGHCDLMLLRHDQGDPDYADLVQIHQNANRAASLVGQLLAFSRKQTLQPQIIDLRDTLSDLTHLLNRLVGERIRLSLNHEPGLPTIRADRRQLEQVIMNLVVNARDAMSEGGEIRIETSTRLLGGELKRDRAKVPPGRYVLVKVEDRGAGIPPDKINKIFEPFYTTKRTGEGTGLGLSTAYGIVKQSGGFIFVDSVVGTGTVFTLYSPAHDGPPEALPVSEPRRAPPARPPEALRIPAAQPAIAMGVEPLQAWAVGAAPGGSEPGFAAERRLVAASQPSAEAAPAAASPKVALVAATPSARAADFGLWHDTLEGTSNGDAGAALAGPAPSEAAAAALHGAKVGAGSAERRRAGEGVILLVEDEAPVRAFASRALRMRGYTVIEAESAEEALATLEDPALEVDVFVTGVIMPGMDGPTWVRQALTARPDVRVVFVSGYAEDSFGHEQARIPNSTFLPKPFSLSELTETVQEQFR